MTRTKENKKAARRMLYRISKRPPSNIKRKHKTTVIKHETPSDRQLLTALEPSIFLLLLAEYEYHTLLPQPS